VAIDPSITVSNITPKQPYQGIRYKETFNLPEVEYLVELVKPKDNGTVAKKVKKGVRRSSRL
jgi:hypothetical protein